MIIENKDELHQLSPYDEWVVHPIYLDDRFHPIENRISCLYLINTIAWDSCIIPIEHSERLGDITIQNVIDYFTEHETNMFVYDKKSVINHIPDYGEMYDVQLLYYLHNDEWVFNSPFNDYYHKWKRFQKINTLIPLAILYDRMDNFYSDKDEEFTKLTKYREIKRDKAYENYDQVIHTLQQVEKNGICKDGKIVYTQYNIYTTTGRPSNRFGGTNYAALNKSDDTRTHYINRYESGAFYLYDYTSFHPTILSNYLKIGRPDGNSLHEQLGRKYFDTNELTEEQYEESKKKTFFYLYGDEILHDDVKDIEFFQKVAEFKRRLNKQDVIETPIFKREMDVEGLTLSKKFNYFLQCFESEINFVKMKQINSFLSDKKSKLVLYTYDSFLIDYSPDDSKEIILSIKEILENGNFTVTIEKGDNYKEMEKLSDRTINI